MTGRFGALTLTALLVFFAGLSAVSGSWLDKRPQQIGGAAAPVYVPDVRFLRALSLGYHNVVADVVWFRTISYFGEHYRTDRVYPWLARMCDIVTDLDPRAAHVYRFAGLVLPWEAHEVDAGIHLLKKGIRVFPNEWRFPYWLGFNYYFFKGDVEAASQALKEASGTHPAVTRFAALLHSKAYGLDTTLQYLHELESQAESPEMRSVLQQHIVDARMAADITRLNAALEQYVKQHGNPPADLQALVAAGLVNEIPTDPAGGRYVIDRSSGAIRSSTGRKPLRMHESRLREQYLQRSRPE